MIKIEISEPVTEGVSLAEQTDFPIRIYDTIGFKISSKRCVLKSTTKAQSYATVNKKYSDN
ncbi:hypothetical protein [Vagococcus vulneris]|uniref:Uncharacterized protein n=1 Tax=Vagococcus vulneris TaxID=1977869 RepID=A0A429ZPA8_9ENTE|nr:hypothetical protein [Vagococcus vulneris]RST95515.1 hypothetical protein CBF37_11435 [Vagococcus vulneris]